MTGISWLHNIYHKSNLMRNLRKLKKEIEFQLDGMTEYFIYKAM